jgi:hypothetical protein
MNTISPIEALGDDGFYGGENREIAFCIVIQAVLFVLCASVAKGFDNTEHDQWRNS